jgi:competence protein ComEA
MRVGNFPSKTAGRAAVAAACAVLALAGSASVTTAQQASDKSAEAFTKVCSTCHDAGRILTSRRTRTQWQEVIEKMIERGAEGTDADFSAVEDYLIHNYGRVNVNRAVSRDLAAVIGISDKEADAIVEYRKANGDFADFDTLCKVPGIDVEKLKAARDGISF